MIHESWNKRYYFNKNDLNMSIGMSSMTHHAFNDKIWAEVFFYPLKLWWELYDWSKWLHQYVSLFYIIYILCEKHEKPLRS